MTWSMDFCSLLRVEVEMLKSISNSFENYCDLMSLTFRSSCCPKHAAILPISSLLRISWTCPRSADRITIWYSILLINQSFHWGTLEVVVNFVMMQIQLCHVFSLETRNPYFGRTLLHGGVRYKVTGRVRRSVYYWKQFYVETKTMW